MEVNSHSLKMDENYRFPPQRRSNAAKRSPALDKSKTRVEGDENCPSRAPRREASTTETPNARPRDGTPGVPLQPVYSRRSKTFKYNQKWTVVHRPWDSDTSPIKEHRPCNSDTSVKGTDGRLKEIEVIYESQKTKRIEVCEQVVSSHNLAGKLLRDRATRKSRPVSRKKRKSRRDLFLDSQTSSTRSQKRASRKRDCVPTNGPRNRSPLPSVLENRGPAKRNGALFPFNGWPADEEAGRVSPANHSSNFVPVISDVFGNYLELWDGDTTEVPLAAPERAVDIPATAADPPQAPHTSGDDLDSQPLGICEVSVPEVSAEEVVSDVNDAVGSPAAELCPTSGVDLDGRDLCRKVSVPNAVLTVSSSTQTSAECSSPVSTEASEEVLETPLSLRTSRRSKNKSCQTRFKPSEEILETPPITRVSPSAVSQSGENASGEEPSEHLLEMPLSLRVDPSRSICSRGENATGGRHGSRGSVASRTADDIEKERQLVVVLERLDASGGALLTDEMSGRRRQRRKSCLKVRSKGYRTRSRSRRRVSFLLDETSPPPTRRVSDSPARRSPSPSPQQLLKRRELPPCLSMGDRVFAKLRGYPPWPAIVTEATREHDVACRYPVYFYGTGETATLHLRDIYPYEEYEGFFGRNAVMTGRKRRRHSLLEAIEQLEAAYVSTRR